MCISQSVINICKKVNASFSVYSDSGEKIYPINNLSASKNEISLSLENSFVTEGIIYKRIDTKPGLIISIPKDKSNAHEILLLAENLFVSEFNKTEKIFSRAEAYKYLLTNRVDEFNANNIFEQFQIMKNMNYCVMMFFTESSVNEGLYKSIQEIVPIDNADVLVEIKNNIVLLIHYENDKDNIKECEELASAIYETLLEETSLQLYIGVSSPQKSSFELYDAFKEAKKAVKVGRQYKRSQNVFIFQSLILELMLTELPKETAIKYSKLLFNESTKKLLNDEMLTTINSFFCEDLNLAEAARNLYIHRNTLVYRLEKVQKALGLDLRHFDDAILFKILMELKDAYK